MKLEIAIDGLTELKDTLGELWPKAEKKILFGIETAAKLSIVSPHATGRLYPRGARGIHQASSPGQAPANDFGFLAAAIQAFPERHVLEVAADYAVYLEPERPFIIPAIEKTLNEFSIDDL